MIDFVRFGHSGRLLERAKGVVTLVGLFENVLRIWMAGLYLILVSHYIHKELLEQ